MIAVATRIALGVTLLVTTVEVVIGPSLSRLRSRESARERAALFWNAWRLLMLLTSPALVALFVFSREILGLFGAEYVQAGLALRLLLVGQFFVVCSGGAANVLVMTGRERLWTKMSGASAVFAIPLLGILGYHLSVEGVALAVMLTPTRAPGASPQAAIMAAARTIRTDHT